MEVLPPKSMEDIPTDVSAAKYERILTSLEIMRFIVQRLRSIGAPVAITYGTLLHEYRNNTDNPCFVPRYNDKDIDLTVFEKHFDVVLNLDDELRSLFGWGIALSHPGRLFLDIAPVDKKSELDFRTAVNDEGTPTLKIDVYGFRCNVPNGKLHFPWDNVTVSIDSYFTDETI